MSLSSVDVLRSVEKLAFERNDIVVGESLKSAISLLERELKEKDCKEYEYESDEEKQWQERYKAKINEDYRGLCKYTDKGDYSGALAVLERNNYDLRFSRTLRTWSIFGLLVAMLLELGLPIIHTAFVTISAFLISWIFFVGSAAALVKKDGFMKWYYEAGMVGKLLFGLFYSAICGGIMYLFLFILN